MAACLVLLALTAAGVWFRAKLVSRPPPPQKAISVLVADFENKTSESIFNGTLEPTIVFALEEAPFLNPYDRSEAHKIGLQLRSNASALDESLARVVALREDIGVIVAGSIARDGEGYTISVKAIDGAGRTIVTQDAKTGNKPGVLPAARNVATRIRKALAAWAGESIPASVAEPVSTGSLEAAHHYSLAQNLHYGGKWEEALAEYSKAIELDPNFGRAYTGAAVALFNLGDRAGAENYFEKAMAHIDQMTDREKHRTRGIHYLMVRNYRQAIEEFNTLVKSYPADSTPLTNLALAHFYARDMPAALEVAHRSVEAFPNRLLTRNNLALYAMYAGDFPAAERDARAVINADASYRDPYLALALSRLAQGQPAEAVQVYERLEKLCSRGASLAADGLADLALYEGRVSDAVSILQAGVAADTAEKRWQTAAWKSVTLGHALVLLGAKSKAVAEAVRAAGWSKEVSVLFPAARIYLELGQAGKASTLASQLASRFEPEPQAYGKLIEAEVQMQGRDYRAAVRQIQEAQKLADTWVGRYDLGRAYLQAGAYTEAHAEFDECLKRRGEATSLFLDDVPTYRILPEIYFYLGRVQESVKSPAAAASYRILLGIKKGNEDPLAGEARRRLEALGGAK